MNTERGTHPGEPEEVRVAVGAALGAVDLVEVGEGELELAGESFDAGTQLAIRERGELVKEWLDDHRVNDDHDQLEGEAVWCKSALRTHVD